MKEAESSVSWEMGNRQGRSPISRPDTHFLALKTGQISACFHPATLPEVREVGMQELAKTHGKLSLLSDSSCDEEQVLQRKV